MNYELEHEKVYGYPFSDIQKNDIHQTISNYKVRFENNSVDYPSLFEKKKCLDAGCGYGRGALFMLSNGAEWVDLVDVSEKNISTSKKNLQKFNFKNCNYFNCSIESLPYEDNTFDLVWSYGVIHHAANTDKCLQELTRVLKVGGILKLFIYGSGGIFWYSMEMFRKILKKVDTEYIINFLKSNSVPPIDISNYVDSWKVHYLRKYTKNDVTFRLDALGYSDVKFFKYGMNYDLNHRKTVYPEDKDWMGEGDLRFIVKKLKDSRSNKYKLSNQTEGSTYAYNKSLTDEFDQTFFDLIFKLKDKKDLSIKVCYEIHKTLYYLMRQENKFNYKTYRDLITKYLKDI